jgi:hypothetical protein
MNNIKIKYYLRLCIHVSSSSLSIASMTDYTREATNSNQQPTNQPPTPHVQDTNPAFPHPHTRYRVVPIKKENILKGSDLLIASQLSDQIASPLFWHVIPTLKTEGNNANVYGPSENTFKSFEDRDGHFDDVYSLNREPSHSVKAAGVNVFYVLNYLHVCISSLFDI